MEANRCIYCSAKADSLEHPLPAAFGEFRDAPLLRDRLCQSCNSTRLGLLDQQLTRCGPEALWRTFYGVQGRTTHARVNVFERGSAGGHRLDLRAMDSALGFDVALQIENGSVRQMRQIVFVEQSGKTHHLPIRHDATPEKLRTDYNRLGIVQPCDDVRIFFDPVTEDWVGKLIEETWPSLQLGPRNAGATGYDGAVGTVVLTNRYFRAIAKIGFHYFLTQFPQHSGHEEMFSRIREYILDETSDVNRANAFVGKRQHALLTEMLDPKVRPNGWRAHLLCAETLPGECLAYVQTFLTGDWQAPIYAVRLANDPSVADCATTGHAYIYYGNGPQGKFAGDALCLESTRADWPAPDFAPVIKSA